MNEITEINTIAKITLGRSNIHGIGVITLRDIHKGEIMYADRMPKIYKIPYGSFDKLFPEIKYVIMERWPNVIHNQPFVYPDARWLSFMNHSEKPNYDPITDTAIRFIKKGEEIFEDYRIVKEYQKIYPWLDATNAITLKLKKNFLDVLIAKLNIKRFVKN